MVNSIINGLFNGVLNIVQTILNIVLTPLNLIFSGIFPNLSMQVGNFNDSFGFMLSRFGAYIGSLIPPTTKDIIIIWLSFLIAYYGIIWTYWLFVRTWKIIQKVKFW